jgi:hypothetical protein
MKQNINEIKRMQELAGVSDINNSRIIHTVIPFFSDGVEINRNDVMSFLSYESAREHAQNLKSQYEIVENELK